jgi:hypothetical protein
MRDSFSVPSLAAGFAAVNASTAVYDAASVIRRRSGGLKKYDNQSSPALGAWEAGHNTKHLNESGDGGDGN